LSGENWVVVKIGVQVKTVVQVSLAGVQVSLAGENSLSGVKSLSR
jgi:hypothetical protein